MKKYRQLHLWIGLLCSVLILVESVTGLLLSEPWLMGGEERTEKRVPFQVTSMNGASGSAVPDGSSLSTASPAERSQEEGFQFQKEKGGAPQGMNSLMGIIHGLHEGRIGSTNVKWLADLAAIAMIILTVTGIALSVQTLRAQSIRRKKRLEVSTESEVS